MTDPLPLPVSLDLCSDDIQPQLRFAGRLLSLVKPGTDTADRVAGFIRRRFEQAYGARPVLNIPPLLALTTTQGTLLAAVGIRRADAGPLFLENYLVAPVETCLPGMALARETVMEIAHLAGFEVGVSRLLFPAVAAYLAQRRMQWVVCTGTTQLRNGLRQLGVETLDLGEADPARLSDGGESWGRYYQSGPRVMAMHVPSATEKLRQAGALCQIRTARACPPCEPRLREKIGGHYGYTA